MYIIRSNAVAVECKFPEIFNKFNENIGIKSKYLRADSIWKNIPNLRKYADDVYSNNQLLNSAQLIKHTLGLLNKFYEKKSNFRLIYLWFNTLGESGYIHRKEIADFSDICAKDSINFQNITWQEFFINLSKFTSPIHKDYVNYLCDRYL